MQKWDRSQFNRRYLSRIFILILVITLLLPAMNREVAGDYDSIDTINLIVRNSGKLSQQDEFDRLDQFDLTAPQLRYPTRTIQVYLPPDYYTSDKRYPVIYLHDGALLFNPSSRDCLYDETLDRLFYEGKTEGIIAVGIFSSPNRWDEYSPWVNDNMHDWIVPAKAASTEGGEGDAYLDFIIDTLKPEIDSRYRTKTGRKNTAIGGFSMGGLISLYAGLERPDFFSRVMAVSPAIWFAEAGDYWLEENQFINYVNSIEVPQDVAFYIDIGTNEWEGVPINAVDQDGNWLGYPFVWVDGANAALNALEAAGVSEKNITLMEFPGGVHEPYDWAGRFDDAILWLFVDRETAPAPGLITATPTVVAPLDPSSTPSISTPEVAPGSGTLTPDVEQVEETSAIPTESARGILPENALTFFVIALLVVSALVVAWLVKLVLKNR